ncbi:MAG TPA: hypothetical protein VMW67_03005 [Desulfobacteria bacterium]|nr:hypothetical protein [Desulfobacteria bacterium]
MEENVKFDKEKLEKRLKEEKDREWVKEDISRRLAVKYLCSDAIVFYVLSKVNSPLVTDFLEAAKSEAFWSDEEGPYGFYEALFYEPFLLWYLSKLWLNENVLSPNIISPAIHKTFHLHKLTSLSFHSRNIPRILPLLNFLTNASFGVSPHSRSRAPWIRSLYHFSNA